MQLKTMFDIYKSWINPKWLLKKFCFLDLKWKFIFKLTILYYKIAQAFITVQVEIHSFEENAYNLWQCRLEMFVKYLFILEGIWPAWFETVRSKHADNKPILYRQSVFFGPVLAGLLSCMF